ncbi:hypothetical protein B0J13DRAFT_640729 [Dactylonectria estremocensis]|uniref:Aminoglycoside phosphotransferase domain-containing protein n=1 Tax=Dactylonectria estremocensis TaxID=1079267 RepID=A0A9P9EGF4_9HYPO|nr:hypothetical protein B0J13DRAFT_640729 [Dactylonectria estremocensis]
MDDSQPPASATYAVSRTRGKQAGEFLLSTKLRDRRTVKGQARSSEESESEDEIGPGCVVLHRLYNCKAVFHPDNTVVNYGKCWPPSCSCLRTTPDGQGRIRMGYIQGQRPDALWPDMSAEHKKDVARQLRARPERMRSVAPPKLIGACDGTEIRDTSQHFTYHSPLCRDEETSNEIILSPLTNTRLRTNHRIVLSHGDLTPRNIPVQDGKIKGLVDWQDSGWYPEYWEYAKFSQRAAYKDWKQYAEIVFPELYHDELVDFIAMSMWQKP